MSFEVVTFAPGSRLLIRDEEWLVKSSLPASTGGAAVRVTGLSEPAAYVAGSLSLKTR